MAEFQDQVQKSRRMRDQLGRLLPLSSRQRDVREAFYLFLKQLNRKGPTAVPRLRGIPIRTQKSRGISPKYLAGFIDAEGSLMLSKAKMVIRWNPTYSAKVYIDNTNRAILEDIQQAYGGTLTCQPARKAGWKPGYKLVWTGRRVETLLSLVEPHLHIKRRRARILLQFIDHKKRTKVRRVGSGLAPLPARERGYRECVYQRMKELNARGPRLIAA